MTNCTQATVDTENKVQTLELDIYDDAGYAGTEAESGFFPAFIQTCYAPGTLEITPHDVKTDTPANTACRAPISTQVIKYHLD